MNKETVERNEKSHTPKASKYGKEGLARAEALLPDGSWQRTAVGVAAAAGGGLLAVALVGAAPAAIAGAAGYLAFRGLTGRKNDDSSKH
jgi:hypothetical protein